MESTAFKLPSSVTDKSTESEREEVDMIGAMVSPIKPTKKADLETPADKTLDMTADSDMSFFSDESESPTKTINDEMANTPEDSLPTNGEVVLKDDEDREGSSDIETPVAIASKASSDKAKTPTVETANESDKEKLQAIMERRRKMEEDGTVLSDIPKEQKTRAVLDSEVQEKLERRRALSDDGIIVAEATERRAGTKKEFGLDAEVQAKLERRRALSDDGSNITGDVDKRASTRRAGMKSVQMSNDLQAIMARRRQAADAENAAA